MRHQDVFHQFLLGDITATAIAEVVLGTGTHSFLEVTLLQSFHEGSTHHCREVCIFAIRLLQAIEAGCTTDVHHRRQGEDASHLTHGRTCLACLHLSQFGIERTGLSNLLGIDGCPTGIDT